MDNVYYGINRLMGMYKPGLGKRASEREGRRRGWAATVLPCKKLRDNFFFRVVEMQSMGLLEQAHDRLLPLGRRDSTGFGGWMGDGWMDGQEQSSEVEREEAAAAVEAQSR